MTSAQRLAELRAKATGTYWERYGFIGHYDLARVRCPIGCDQVGRQKYADVPVHGHDAAFIVYAANHAADIAARERELEEEKAKWQRIVAENCEAISECRAMAVKHLGQLAAYGDSYGVPAIGDVVESLCTKLATKDAEIAKLRAENQTAADALDKQHWEIERLREELAAANSEIGGLESLVEDLQEDLYGDESE